MLDHPQDRLSLNDIRTFLSHPNLIVCQKNTDGNSSKGSFLAEELGKKLLVSSHIPSSHADYVVQPVERRGRRKEERQTTPQPINFQKFI